MTNFVTPERQLPATVTRMTDQESAMLQGLTSGALQPAPLQLPTLPPATHSGHLRENYDISAQARATLTHAIADIIVFAGITLAIVLLVWYQIGGDLLLYGLAGIVGWGAVSYLALNRNRAQAYGHSPAGVARLEQQTQLAEHDRSAQVEEHRIDSQERVAMHAIDKTAELLKARWQIERGEQ